MTSIIKKGAPVRQIVKPIQGCVVNQTIVDDEIAYEVEFTAEDGEKHSRVFKASELEEVVAGG